MTVYIEYVFLQNFFLDGVLIWLAYKGVKRKIRWGNLLLSSSFGGGYAVVYPLLRLPTFLGFVLTISAGLLLCLLAYGKVTGKGWKVYAFFTMQFFALSFLFGGALGAITKEKQLYILKMLGTPLLFLLFSVFCVYFFYKRYQRKGVMCLVYDCVIANGEKSIKTQGFYDSGNMATKRGIPVCFVTPEIIYELWEKEGLILGEGRGHVCDELSITTMAGARKAPLYKGCLSIRVEGKKIEIKEVYFSPSVNMISREYAMILPSRIFDEGETL